MNQIITKAGAIILVDESDFERVSSHTWSIAGHGYPQSAICGKSVLLHRWLMDAADGQQVDHANGNKLDNRRANLRFATRSQNAANQGIRSTNKSGFRGVHQQGTKWRASVKKDGKEHYIGHFDRKEDAARAYNQAAVELFGEFARLNTLG